MGNSLRVNYTVAVKHQPTDLTLLHFPEAAQLRKCYAKNMEDEYLADKTTITVVQRFAGKQLVPMAVDMKVDNVLEDYLGYRQNAPTAVLNAEISRKQIREALMKCVMS